ncbi:hypothetical protein EYB53_004435 [Candidatus Chloroploca sp. M-50]|uniref:Nbr1 FW domain-containing protein n=1 Tax=Candidatus Chloroploca mongolica TaxID=2528176 RepID=A0ABS4D687_9CHLR|nr:NBR1-Ig-like domain-containing protein [Candidatus Chloroploca mongolica]MBP1464951.1 hypothetical protein [Candidatus Chloroploca mongolica]
MGKSLRCLRMLGALSTLTLLVLLLPDLVRGQQTSFISDEERRFIFVPGIHFKNFPGIEDFDNKNACFRAIEETFPGLHALLISNNERTRRGAEKNGWRELFKTMPIFKPDQIYAFDYSLDQRPNLPCVRYDRQGDNGNAEDDILHDQSVNRDQIKANTSTYAGEDTRTRLTTSFPEEERQRWSQVPPFDPPPAYAPTDEVKGSSERFDLQFKAWRKECPDCHFDIIAHSLGGAVVAYWVSTYASDEDRQHVRSITTIDSPVNGIKANLIDFHPFILKSAESLLQAGGQATIDLEDESFIAAMRRAPDTVDMRCISNIYDALIPPQAALIRSWSQDDLLYAITEIDLWFTRMLTGRNEIRYRGACDNKVGRYGQTNPYTELDLGKVGAAHTEPLAHPQVQLLTLQRLHHDPPLWTRRNSVLEAWLERNVRSQLKGPGDATTVNVVLRNTGNGVWKPGQVEFRLVGGNAFGLDRNQPINQIVRPNETITLTLTFNAPEAHGPHPSRWRLARGTTYFGPEVIFGVIVLPTSDLDPDQIFDDPGTILRVIFDKFVSDTQQRIEEEVERLIAELQRQLIEQFFRALCGVTPAIVIVGWSSAIWRLRQRQRVTKAEVSNEL